MSLRDYVTNIAAEWASRRNGGTWLQTVGATLDGAIVSCIEGTQAGDPFLCDPSILPLLSADRKIRLYATEPDASKRFRLSRWRQIRRASGSHYGQLINLQPYFLPYRPVLKIVHQSNDPTPVATWHILDADGNYSTHQKTPSNWNWDGVPGKWSRYTLIVHIDAIGLPAAPAWDGGQLWDGGSIWGGSLTDMQIADIVSIVGDPPLNPPHAKLWSVILAPDPASFDPTATAATLAGGWTTLPTGNWGYPIDFATGFPTRLQGAAFVFDLGHG